MNITCLVENTSRTGLPVEHGLSLYIETATGTRILFDTGQSNLFAENAKRLNIPLQDVDFCVLSHGHYDHGGGLGHFMQINKTAPIYVSKDASKPYYSMKETGLRYIGLDNRLIPNPRFIFCSEPISIDGIAGTTGRSTHNVLGNNPEDIIAKDSTILFSGVEGNCCEPYGNRLLYGPSETEHDTFCHEQNMIVTEGRKTILFAGCAHAGIINILQKATQLIGTPPTHVFAGMHLVKSGLGEVEEAKFIEMLASQLMSYKNCRFYTMHCTGTTQYRALKEIMGEQIRYLSCGQSIII